VLRRNDRERQELLQNKAGVNEEYEDSPLPDGMQIESAYRSVLEVEHEVEAEDGKDCGGAEKVKVCAIS